MLREVLRLRELGVTKGHGEPDQSHNSATVRAAACIEVQGKLKVDLYPPL